MRLALRQPDGNTLRDHLQAAAIATGQVDPLLTEQVPRAGAALWDAFVELAGARPTGMGSAGAVPPSEVAAWQQLHGLQLSPWELDTLSGMDRASLAVASAHNTRTSPGAKA